MGDSPLQSLSRRPLTKPAERKAGVAVAWQTENANVARATAASEHHEEVRDFIWSLLRSAPAKEVLKDTPSMRTNSSAQVLATTVLKQRDVPKAVCALLESKSFDEEHLEKMKDWLR